MLNQITYCINRKVYSFDKDLLTGISMKYDTNSIHYTSIVNKVGLYFTAGSREVIDTMKKYYQEMTWSSFTGPIVHIHLMKAPSYDNKIFWITEQDNLLKGQNQNGDTFYCFNNNMAKVTSTGHRIEVHYVDKEFSLFLPLLIKVIEGVVIEHHIGLGFFPVHGALMIHDGKVYMLLGSSQSGKTTLMELLAERGYQALSDDIIFLDLHGRAYPFGHYVKQNCDDRMDKRVCEDFYVEQSIHITRRIIPIPSTPYENGLNIDCIVFPSISAIEEAELYESSMGETMLHQLLSDYPNGYFVEADFNYCQAAIMISQLLKCRMLEMRFAYNKDNGRVVKLWEKNMEQ